MLWHLALFVWLAGAVPASYAAPPLGCVENQAGARWCDWPTWNQSEQRPVQVVFNGPHPATIRRAPVPVSGHPAIVRALPASDLLPWRGPAFAAPGPRVEVVKRSDGVKIGERR